MNPSSDESRRGLFCENSEIPDEEENNQAVDPDSDIPNCGLNAVIIFNDVGLIQHAKAKVLMIEEKVGGVRVNEIQMINLMTLFEYGDPNASANVVAEADIVFLALNVIHLSDEWKSWFWRWARLREGIDTGVIACIFGSRASGWFAASIREFFEGIAREGRMQFMYHAPVDTIGAGTKATWEIQDRS